MKSKNFLITTIVLFSVIVALNPSIAKADIQVYDNNNQYLGILLELGNTQLSLFIPSLGASWIFQPNSSPCGDEANAYFVSSDCSGQPYSRGPLPYINDLTGTDLGGYFKPDYSAKENITPGSRIDFNCGCQSTSSYPQAEYYPLTQLQMPFTTPIALPLRFEVRTRAVVIPLN